MKRDITDLTQPTAKPVIRAGNLLAGEREGRTAHCQKRENGVR